MYSLATLVQYMLLALVIYIMIRVILVLTDPEVRAALKKARLMVRKSFQEAYARAKAKQNNTTDQQ